MSITIRHALVGDLDRITEIYADAVLHSTATYELEPPTRTDMGERFAALMDGGYPYLVAERQGVIVGYAYAGPFRARPAYRFIVEDSIYIAPEAKGAGIGKALMQTLITECTGLGFRQIVAVIGDGHADSASVRLHERLGFGHTGRMDGSGYKHGRWLDTVFMQMPLNGGASTPPDPNSMPERQFRARGGKG
ncbi:GNAT family N-acetyltransferase [Mesorhizobium sp. ANAO-SY3R2]|uniref:GNAT family N-acetyltransferase n=1 Tax=Mesorhizobium sp. ANAO-SY3R2 TaxID=3166644 RepID=UPI00366F4AAE